MIATIFGGIGLFLLGMVLLTDGLKAAAGGALRTVLARFTGGTLRAIASGAGVTALVQSSSATVLTTIGFVSAGLLTLRQATGVIFGANVGTTSTGWIVSLLGLKLSIGAWALPLVGAGALLRLLTHHRMAGFGIALAGFGLIFVGIDVLQEGMGALSARIDPATLPGSGPGARLLLVLSGAVMTVIMQSSSAAVATTLTALHTGAITLEQAAALVVGQNIGTTVTAALAALGASVHARRTAVVHILFNVFTGTVAFLLVPAAVAAYAAADEYTRGVEPAVLIAGFHTVFNVLGVLLLAPFITPFTRLVQRLVPDRGPQLTRRLDPSVAELAPVAVEAARRTVMDIGDVVLGVLRRALEDPRRDRIPVAELERAAAALGETRLFLARVRTSATASEHARHLAVHHAADHTDRLIERLLQHTPPRAPAEPGFDRRRHEARQLLPSLRHWLTEDAGDSHVDDCRSLSEAVAIERRTARAETLARTASGDIDPNVANAELEAMRWLDSSLYHVWRMMHHLAGNAVAGDSTDAVSVDPAR
jgi:phosphate:Na+ symporter